MLDLKFPVSMAAKAKPMRSFGWAIRKVRRVQGLTLEQLANAIGSDAGNLSRLEKGAQNAPEDLLKAISAELGLSMSQLWQIAESDSEAAAAITAKIGKLDGVQLAAIEQYVDFLLSQKPDA